MSRSPSWAVAGGRLVISPALVTLVSQTLLLLLPLCSPRYSDSSLAPLPSSLLLFLLNFPFLLDFLSFHLLFSVFFLSFFLPSFLIFFPPQSSVSLPCLSVVNSFRPPSVCRRFSSAPTVSLCLSSRKTTHLKGHKMPKIIGQKFHYNLWE